MIKLQPNTFSADLLPLGNPRQTVATEEGAWKDRVNEMVRGRQKPLNAPNVVSVTMPSEYGRSAYQISPTGIYVSSYQTIDSWQTLQPTSAYKLSNVNNIDLYLSTSFEVQAGLIPPSAPVADSDYTMYYMTTIGFQPDVSITPSSDLSYLQDYFTLVIAQQFVYDKSENAFTFLDGQKTLRLSETIDTRRALPSTGISYPDFNDNPEQITHSQYERIVQEGGNIYITSGFDTGQLGMGITTHPVLSAGNQNHFNYYYNSPDITDVTYIQLRTTAILTYSGLFANYAPVDNA
jgi:hypothetical protein